MHSDLVLTVIDCVYASHLPDMRLLFHSCPLSIPPYFSLNVLSNLFLLFFSFSLFCGHASCMQRFSSNEQIQFEKWTEHFVSAYNRITIAILKYSNILLSYCLNPLELFHFQFCLKQFQICFRFLFLVGLVRHKNPLPPLLWSLPPFFPIIIE